MSRNPARIALTTAVVSAVLGKPLEQALIKLGAWDVPNERSSHDRPVPRLGGIAPAVGATVVAFQEETLRLPPRVCIAVSSLAALGLVDDVTGHLSIRLRLLVQLGAGCVLGRPETVDRALAAIATTGVVNVTNFMDGINGMSGMTALVWGLNALLESQNIPPSSGDGALDDYILLGALVAGCALGFLPYNAPRARLFLGDVGSYSLGAAMAAGILSRSTITARYRAASPLLLYAVDAAQALARRRINGEPLGQAHRNHVYQQLVDAGAGHMAVATFHAALSAAVARASYFSTPKRWLTTSLLSGLYLISPKVIGRVDFLTRGKHDARTTCQDDGH